MKKHSRAEIDLANLAENETDLLVCFCMKISRKTLVSAIADGASSLDLLMQGCRAGTGCGTCRVDLIHLIAENGRTSRDE